MTSIPNFEPGQRYRMTTVDPDTSEELTYVGGATVPGLEEEVLLFKEDDGTYVAWHTAFDISCSWEVLSTPEKTTISRDSYPPTERLGR
jgi:hypothetical protein